jgi:hypothetical protein
MRMWSDERVTASRLKTQQVFVYKVNVFRLADFGSHQREREA